MFSLLSVALSGHTLQAQENIASPASDTVDIDIFANIVIQHEGRLKPLDTFARNQLLLFSEKSSLKNKSAIEWLIGSMFDPFTAFNEKIFKIRNNKVVEALGIEVDLVNKHTYSFSQIIEGIESNRDMLQKILIKPQAEREPTEKQLAALYFKSFAFLDICRSFTCLIPDIPIDNPELVQELGFDRNQVSMYDFLPKTAKLRQLLIQLNEKDSNSFTEKDKAIQNLQFYLSKKLGDQESIVLKIIPPDSDPVNNQWVAPWEHVNGNFTDTQLAYLADLQTCVTNFHFKNYEKFETQLNAFKSSIPYKKNIDLEVLFYKLDLFTWSLALYILTFLLLLIYWLSGKKFIFGLSVTTVSLSAILHVTGIILRMIIRNRPPVSTLYESIIFVGAVIVIFGLIIEWRQRNTLGTFLACSAGVILQFIGIKFSIEGDTMGMLVAVLDSNFWLSTHVVTIVIGYGTTFVAGLIGHAYLAIAIFKPGNKKLIDLMYKNAVGATLVSLFFTTLGTILGGIWADQSWGRFWGWDPKENGAMLIVLWLLMLTHGRLTGILRGPGFAAGLVLGNICVALAWFGVNLLSVGLHNYGFTESQIGLNILIFSIIEISIAFVGFIVIKLNETTQKSNLTTQT